MKDVLDELAAARRSMGTASLPAGDAYTMELRRRYDAPVEDVWRVSWLFGPEGDEWPGTSEVEAVEATTAFYAPGGDER